MNNLLKNIIAECEKLGATGKRNVENNSCELIFDGKERSKLNEFFSHNFGPAIKPTGRRPSTYDICLTRPYGGVESFQKLYSKNEEDNIIIALFKPWRFDTHITVVLAIQKTEDIEKRMKSMVMKILCFLSRIRSDILGSRH